MLCYELSYEDLFFDEGVVVRFFKEKEERVEAEEGHEERHRIEHYLEDSIFSFGHGSCQNSGLRKSVPHP